MLTLLSATGAPPTEVRLFRYGLNRTLKGPFHFTPRSARLVMAQWKAWGRDFGFDYEHSTFDKQVRPQDREACGWGRLELRADGLWAVDITWTAEAREKIAQKRFRYVSPVPLHEKESREVVGVLNCALTNLPATLEAPPLVLSAHLLSMDRNKIVGMMYVALTALMGQASMGAESDDAELATLSKAATEVCAPLAAKLQEMLPPGGAEGPSLPEMCSVHEAAAKVTGSKEGLVGALLALGARDKLHQQKDRTQGERDKLIAQIVRARKHHPAELEELAALSMADLRTYLKDAPQVVPGPAESQVAATQLSAQPSAGLRDKAAAAAGDAGGESTPEVDALLAKVQV